MMEQTERIGSPPAQAALAASLEKLIPGTSAATRRLRSQILDFSFDPTARTVFLKGPIGVGKSTLARVIAFTKRAALVTAEEATLLISNLRFAAPGLIDEKVMHWYIELPLTGLVETLAEAQLFGTEKGAGTGIPQRPGVFELAQTGRRVGGGDSSAVKVTGGIVFLDEVAELSHALQAKLLPVLSGGVFHRVGGERYDLTFRGVTVAASWKGLTKLRPDLVSRLTDRVIEIPTISQREGDVVVLIDNVQNALISDHRDAMNKLSVEPTVAPYWRTRAERVEKLNARATKRLASVDWDAFGNMRGLSNAVRQMLFTGKDIDSILTGLERIELNAPESSDESFVAELLRRNADGTGLASHVRDIEVRRRTALRERLMSDEGIRSQLSEKLGIQAQNLEIQAKQLNRSRRRRKRALS